MLRLACCLLLAISVIAANAYPADGNYGPVGPNTNLVYNFEQIRSDQPPHVEMREENIHKYMNRPRTTPVPLLRSRPLDNGERPRHPLPYNAMQWEALQKAPIYQGPTQNWKSVPAPPSFPHWDSLSDLAATNPINYESHPIPQQPFEVAPEAYQRNPEDDSLALDYRPSLSSTATPMYEYSSTMRPMRHVAPRHSPRSHHSHGGRRGQKYNMNNAVNYEPSSTTPAPIQISSRPPPPAVPTLTPWLDGF